MPHRPAVRGKVFKSGHVSWWWHYSTNDYDPPGLRHGPFASWREAYDSARRMVELL